MPDVYWHTCKGMWSLRVDGRVTGHHPRLQLVDVRFVVRMSAIERIRRTRQREVCAWATGSQVPLDYHPGECYLREIIFDPYLQDDFFHESDETTVTACQGLLLDPDGRAWEWYTHD